MVPRDGSAALAGHPRVTIDVLRSAEEVVLETRGRRTGRPHRVTVWSAYEDGVLWLRADAESDWLRNLVADARCRVHVGGVAFEAIREPIDDEAAALRHIVALWRSKYGPEWVGDWYVERGRVPVRLRVQVSA